MKKEIIWLLVGSLILWTNNGYSQKPPIQVEEKTEIKKEGEEEIPVQIEIKKEEGDINLRIIKDKEDLTISNVYRCQNIPVEELVDFVSSALSKNGSFAVLKDQNAILITDFPVKVNSLIEAIRELDKQKGLGSDGISNYFYRFQNISGGSAIPFIQQRLSNKGRIIFDNTLNTIMVSDIPSKIDEVKEIIKNIDILSSQVEIEVAIMEIEYSKGQKVGLDWNHIFEALSFNVDAGYGKYSEDWHSKEEKKDSLSYYKYERWQDTLRESFNINIENISTPLSLSEFLNLLVSSGSAKIKATPKISILNNQMARLEFTDSIPYIAQSPYSKRENEENVGLNLEVMPQITTNGFIKLIINTSYNTLNGFTSQNTPLITFRKTNTTVILKDGQPFFISGLMKTDKVLAEKKIPGMGDIPIIGYLFKRKISHDKTTETVITLTPKIINVQNKIKEE